MRHKKKLSRIKQATGKGEDQASHIREEIKVLKEVIDEYKTNKAKIREKTEDLAKDMQELKRESKRHAMNGEELVRLDLISDCNEWTLRFWKAPKFIQRTYQHEIRKIQWNEFEVIGGGLEQRFILLKLNRHFFKKNYHCELLTCKNSFKGFQKKTEMLREQICCIENELEDLKQKSRSIKSNIKKVKAEIQKLRQIERRLAN